MDRQSCVPRPGNAKEAEPDRLDDRGAHKTAHQAGCPGLFGFSPQDMRVYIDNIEVKPD
jgi:hypothetical protein